MEKDLNVRMGKPGDEKDDKRVRKFIIAGVSLLLVIIAVLTGTGVYVKKKNSNRNR